MGADQRIAVKCSLAAYLRAVRLEGISRHSALTGGSGQLQLEEICGGESLPVRIVVLV